MQKTPCPHCGEETITVPQRLRASHWMDTHCSACGGRIAMTPIMLALLYFVIVWDIFFFGYVAVYEKSLSYGIAMVVGWALLEFFGSYIPLVRLRPKLQS